MKVVVAGSRTLDHSITYYALELEKMLQTFENQYGQITMIVSGAARGPDKLGEAWAKKNKVQLAKFPAQWDLHGKAAGPIRNQEMGEFADGAVVMWDGESTGALHMSKVMLKLKKPFIIDTFAIMDYNARHPRTSSLKGL